MYHIWKCDLWEVQHGQISTLFLCNVFTACGLQVWRFDRKTYRILGGKGFHLENFKKRNFHHTSVVARVFSPISVALIPSTCQRNRFMVLDVVKFF